MWRESQVRGSVLCEVEDGFVQGIPQAARKNRSMAFKGSLDFGRCLQAANQHELAQRLAAEIKALPVGLLPLDGGCSQGGMIDDSELSTTLLQVDRHGGRVLARVGVFFSEVVGGCNCSDDPVKSPAYCVLEVRIDLSSGLAEIRTGAD